MPTGRVDYFHETSGYGFVVSGATAEDVFFHMNEVGEEDPEPGQHVEFEYVDTEEGPRATALSIVDGAAVDDADRTDGATPSDAGQTETAGDGSDRAVGATRAADPGSSTRTTTGGATGTDPADAPTPERPWTLAADDPPDLELSSDDWELVDLLDRGGFAHVYEARLAPDPARRYGDDVVAVKVPSINPETTTAPDDVEDIFSEAELWQTVDDHDHVVTVLDSGFGQSPWIAMEYMAGGTLGTRAPLPPGHALGVVEAVLDVLVHAHDRGVVHGDLTPANVLLSGPGREGVPKVADWGLARDLLETTSQSGAARTPAYAAPEQLEEAVTTVRDRKLQDIYQAGAVAYHVLTGRPPFEGTYYAILEKVRTASPPPPSEVNPDVPPSLDDPVLAALAKEPADRPPTVFHLRDRFPGL
jgi:cold shock CspA family protein